MSPHRIETVRVDAIVSDMLLASDGSGDLLPDGAVEELLHTLRLALHLDVVFVAQFIDGQRVFRFVDRAATAPPVEPGRGDALEASFCQRVVDGRLPEFIADAAQLGPEVDVPPLPFPVGTHISTPVVLADGSVFGTLCCFGSVPQPEVQEEDMSTLRHCAKLVARKLDRADAKGLKDLPARARSPRAGYRSEIWNLRSAWALQQDAQRTWLES